jgi:hypothetical protein
MLVLGGLRSWRESEEGKGQEKQDVTQNKREPGGGVRGGRGYQRPEQLAKDEARIKIVKTLSSAELRKSALVFECLFSLYLYLVSSLHDLEIIAASNISAAYLPPPTSRKKEDNHTSLIGRTG